jgi:hypothetical protein
MPDLLMPFAAVPAALPFSVRSKIVSAASEPAHGNNWLHEVKHDGHRLIAIIAGPGSMKLLSRNGKDRGHFFFGAQSGISPPKQRWGGEACFLSPTPRWITGVSQVCTCYPERDRSIGSLRRAVPSKLMIAGPAFASATPPGPLTRDLVSNP